MNKNTVYILQKDYDSPREMIKSGVSYTAKEWMKRLPFLRENDFDDPHWFKSKEQEICNLIERYLNGEMNNPAPKEEPQWEILEVTDKAGKIWKRYFYNGNPHICGNNYEYVLQSKIGRIFDIKTVKRFPDNTVWSVGEINMGKTIEKFHNGWNGLEIHYTDGSATLFMEATKQAPKEEQVPHRCKYCNALVTSDSDEGCYANPNKPVDNIGSEGKTFTAPESLSQHPMCKTEEQVPIKVESIAFYTSFGEKQIRDTFAVNLSNNISEDKLQQIKSAIERELNNYKDERPVPYASYKHLFDQHQELLSEFSKMHTSEELLQARRDAFYAGRSFDCWNVSSHQYAKFEDYINSLK